MTRWLLCCAVASGLTSIFDTLSGGGTGLDVFVVLAAACATFIACGVCVLFVSAYVYFYLAYERW